MGDEDFINENERHHKKTGENIKKEIKIVKISSILQKKLRQKKKNFKQLFS